MPLPGRAAAIAVASLAVAAATLPAACTSGTSHPSTASPTGPVAHFVLGDGTTPPNFLDVPFPSDAYLANGQALSAIPGLEKQVPNANDFINYAFSKLNGFSRIALAVFAVDDPTADAGAFPPVASAVIDPTSLPVAETDCIKGTSSVYLVDLAPADPTKALLPCRAAFHDDRPLSKTTPVIAVGPARGLVLAEAHPYAVVLTSRVKDTTGRHLGASADFATVAAGTAKGAIGATYMKAYATASASLKSALAADGASIISLAPYTTMKKTGELFAMREALETATPPPLKWDAATMAPMGATRFAKVVGSAALPAGFTASTDAWLGVVDASGKLPDGTDNPDTELPVRAHDQIAAMGTAVFTATSYLQVEPNGYTDKNNGTITFDASGNPVAQAPVKIWVTIGVPTTPMPTGGYPVVIVQHGIGGSREALLTLANTFAKQGWAVAAIDSVTFGARAAEASNTVDAANDFAGPGSTYKGPDGFADTENVEGDFFGNLESVLAICNQFREAGFDTAQLVQVLRSNPDISPLQTGTVAPAIDPTRVAYIGDSLGAMEGTIAAAIEPRVKAWFLNVNSGSFFTDIATHSPAFGPLLNAAGSVEFGVYGDTFSWSHPLVQVLQTIFEPGDPISYASYLTTSPHSLAGAATQPRNAVQVEAIWDELVTDEGGEAIARAAGWGLAVPNVGSNADITSLTDISANPRATPFEDVSPDSAGAIHDTPVAGTTAVLVQCGPCQHGLDLVASKGAHGFKVPYLPPYTALNPPLTFTEDFQGIQTMGTTFFSDAFQGKVPRVMGFAAPVRDETN